MKRRPRAEGPVLDTRGKGGSAASAAEGEVPNLGETAIRGISWNVVKSLLSRLVTTAVFIILARMLDPADFGIVALASVFIVLISVLVESGFAEAIIQRKELTAIDLNSAFWINNAIGVAFAVVLIAAADVLSQALGQPQLAPVLRALSAVFVLGGLASVPQAILRRQLAFRALALRGLVGTSAGGAVGVAMAVAGAGVWSLVGQMVATAAVGTASLWALCSWRPGRGVSVSSLKELLRFSARILGERLALFTSRRSDDLLIGVVLGPVALGLYTVGYRILLILTETIIWTLEGVAFPLLSRLQNDAVRRRRAFLALTELCAVVAVPAFLAFAILAPEVTRVAFGLRWIEAIPVMQALACIGIPHAALYCNKAALNASGRPDLSLRIAILTCIVTVIGFASVVKWGIVAVAASYAVCSYLLVPVSLWVVTRVLALDMKSYARVWVAPLISGGVMAVSMLGAKALLGDASADLLKLAVGVVVGIASYMVTLCLTAWRKVRKVVSHVRFFFSQGRPPVPDAR